jgi:hypothetical protein
MKESAEIIFLPKIKTAETDPPTDISAGRGYKRSTSAELLNETAAADIVLLFLSVLRMAKRKLPAAQFNELIKYCL